MTRGQESVALIQPQRGNVARLGDHHHARGFLLGELIDGGLDQRTAGTLPLRRFVDGEVDSTTMVEELLRWVTPVLHHSRWCKRTVEVAGKTINAGDRLTLWMISANHDEAAFDRADEFDIGRDPNHHVALGGGGPHFCLGSHLARLESVVTFETLRPLLSSMKLTAPPQRVRSNFINGMKHLEVAVG